MPELDEITEPVDATPEPEPFTLPENFATQVQSWEVPLDVLPQAVDTYKKLQTEEGTIDTFISTGLSLGFGIKELNRLFADEEPPPAPPVAPAQPGEPEDPERWMTAAEVKQMVEEIRQEQHQFAQTQEQRAFQAKQQQVFSAIDTWFEAQGITDEQTRRQIASFGEKHVLPTQDGYDAKVTLAALERGKAEYEGWVEAEAQKYLKSKGLVAQAQPTPPGGGQAFAGSGSDDAPVEYAGMGQKAYETAKERVRNKLRAAGELG